MPRRLHASIIVLFVVGAFRYHVLQGVLEPTTEKIAREQTIGVTLDKNNEPAIQSRNNTKIQLDDSFRPGNLEWSTRVPCGSQKCMYRLKSDPRFGYLVASEQHSSGRSKLLEFGWKFAKQLEREHGIKHFLAGPPTKVKVSKELARRLRRNLYAEKYRKKLKGKTAWRRYPKGSIIHVQKVRLAPKRHLLMGCVDSKVDAFQKDLPSFLSYVTYKEKFVKTFSEGLAETKKLLEVEPSLVKDFQLFVDTRGNIYHLDFDRCFRSSGEKWRMSETVTRSCLEALDKMDHDIQHALKSKL